MSTTQPSISNNAMTPPPAAEEQQQGAHQQHLPLPILMYKEFGGLGATPWLVVPATILSVISLFGIALNGSVVYVTVRTKALRGTCSYLLALVSLLECCHLSGHFIYLTVVTVGGQFIEEACCLPWHTVPMFGLHAIQVALACTAVDRLFASVGAVFYKQVNDHSTSKYTYLGILMLICTGFGGYAVTNMYITGGQFAGLNMTCDVGDVVNLPSLNGVFIWGVYGFNGVGIVLYACVWLFIRKNIQSSDTQTRLFKSLLTIVCVNLGGYIINISLINTWFASIQNNFFLLWVLFNFNSGLLNACAAANAPILYFMSADYRTAFRRFLFLSSAIQPAAAVAVARVQPQRRIMAVPPQRRSNQPSMRRQSTLVPSAINTFVTTVPFNSGDNCRLESRKI